MRRSSSSGNARTRVTLASKVTEVTVQDAGSRQTSQLTYRQRRRMPRKRLFFVASSAHASTHDCCCLFFLFGPHVHVGSFQLLRLCFILVSMDPRNIRCTSICYIFVTNGSITMCACADVQRRRGPSMSVSHSVFRVGAHSVGAVVLTAALRPPLKTA